MCLVTKLNLLYYNFIRVSAQTFPTKYVYLLQFCWHIAIILYYYVNLIMLKRAIQKGAIFHVRSSVQGPFSFKSRLPADFLPTF